MGHAGVDLFGIEDLIRALEELTNASTMQLKFERANPKRALAKAIADFAVLYDRIWHLVACGHYQSGFAGLVHAAEPAFVGKRLARLLFIVLPDLHRLAAAWARITVTRDDDAQLSNPLPLQIVPASAPHHLNS